MVNGFTDSVAQTEGSIQLTSPLDWLTDGSSSVTVKLSKARPASPEGERKAKAIKDNRHPAVKWLTTPAPATMEDVQHERQLDAESVDGTANHLVDLLSGSVTHVLPDTVGFVGDVASMNHFGPSKIHPPGSGPISRKMSELHDRYIGADTLPRNKGEEYGAAMARGAADTAALGGPSATARLLAAGLTGGASAQAASDAFPDSEWAPFVAGIVGGGAPEAGRAIHGKVRLGKMIRDGSAHPDFDRMTQVVLNLEGGGSLANPKTNAKSGAHGPMQVTADTARDPGYGIRPWNGKTEADLARVGRQKLAVMLSKYDGDTGKALAAYNWGEGNVDKAVAKHGDTWFEAAPKETRDYLKNGLEALDEPRGGSVKPMAPEELAGVMNDPRATGGPEAAADALASDYKLGDGIDIEKMADTPVEHSDADEIMLESIRNRHADNFMNSMLADKSNIADLGEARVNRDAVKAREAIDDKIYSAADTERQVLNGENYLTPAEATEQRKIAEKLHEMLPEDHAYKARTAELVDIWRSIEDNVHKINDLKSVDHLTAAEQQEMDASADKPVVDNTGHEKFTLNPEAKTPANDSGDFANLQNILDTFPSETKQELTSHNKLLIKLEKDFKAGKISEEKYDKLLYKIGKAHADKRSFQDLVKDLWDDESGTLHGDDEIDAVKKLRKALSEARPLRREQAKEYYKARSERLKKVVQTQKNTSGEGGFHAELSQLKGALNKVDYEGVRDRFTQTDIDELFNLVKNHPRMDLFEKINARKGLAKMLGADGGAVPTRGELKLLSEVFPSDILDQLTKHRRFAKNIWDHAGNALNIPRSLMASFDLSAPFRQGVFLVGRKEFYSSFASMFKQFGSEKTFRAMQDEIRARPTHDMMKEARLSLTEAGVDLTAREEQFMSDWAEKIPLIGRGVRASNRAYIGFLNKLRADTFDSLVKLSGEQGIDFNENPKALRDIGRFINAATGRGSLGALNQAAPVLSATFFSPRLMASRIEMLNPATYVKMDPFVRKQALKSLFSFAAIATTVIGLAAAGGADVEADPRSSDFAKIKVGNTRFDILGGFQPYIRTAAQFLSGQVKKQSGEVVDLGKGYKADTRATVIEKFFAGKESPIASFVHDMMRGEDFQHPKNIIGEERTLPVETAERFVPLLAQDTYDAVKEWGAKGLMTGIPAMFGVGVQTYQPKVKKEKTAKTADYSPVEFLK